MLVKVRELWVIVNYERIRALRELAYNANDPSDCSLRKFATSLVKVTHSVVELSIINMIDKSASE